MRAAAHPPEGLSPASRVAGDALIEALRSNGDDGSPSMGAATGAPPPGRRPAGATAGVRSLWRSAAVCAQSAFRLEPGRQRSAARRGLNGARTARIVGRFGWLVFPLLGFCVKVRA